MQKEPFRYTQRVAFELSNRCNYAVMHVQCPAHHQQDVQILSADVVHNVIDGLAAGGFNEQENVWVEWHIYNEPMIDPRLSEFIVYAKNKLPNVGILVWTNGWYLNETLLDELTALGVTRWTATAYGKDAKRRLTALFDNGPRPAACKVIDGRLDNRISKKAAVKQRKCAAPLKAICIYSSGHFGLCCRDTEQEIKFVDLNGRDFLDVFRSLSQKLRKMRRSLVSGRRWLDPCIRCGRKLS